MKTLKEHNKDYLNQYEPPLKDILNNIECPECKEELSDDLTVVLTTYPPQARTFCKNCDFVGSRY